MNYTTKQAMDILTLADNYARNNSTCKKTVVGCYLVNEGPWRTVVSKGCNCSEVSCLDEGCLREELFGNNSKEHRATCRCYGHHAEQDALQRWNREKPADTAFVTRYPCDECAEALVKAGVRTVIYGREFPISGKAETLFEEAGVEVVHLVNWNCDLNDNNN